MHFSEASQAQFSHGLCPDCVTKYSEFLPLDAPASVGSSD